MWHTGKKKQHKTKITVWMYFPRWVNTYEYLLRILGGSFKGHGMLHNAMTCCTMLQCALFWRIWAQEVPPLLCEAFGWLRRRKTTTGRSDSRCQISILVTPYRMSRARRARPTEPLSPCRKLVPVGSAARFQAEISAVLLPCKVKRVMLPFFLLLFFAFAQSLWKWISDIVLTIATLGRKCNSLQASGWTESDAAKCHTTHRLLPCSLLPCS